MPTRFATDILAAAIDGLEMQKKRVDAQIAELRRMLGRYATSAAEAKLPRKRAKIGKARRKAAGPKKR